MGRLLVILLVMLLPLRGWSAERMAMQMADSPAVVAVAGAQASVAPMVAMPADCPMLAQAVSATDKPTPLSKSHSGCQTCQLCMSLAAPEDLTLQVPAQEPQAVLLAMNASFISADLARQAKPPIL